MLFTHRTLKLVVPNRTLTESAPDENFAESPGHIKRCSVKLSSSRLQLSFQSFVCWPASILPLLILPTTVLTWSASFTSLRPPNLVPLLLILLQHPLLCLVCPPLPILPPTCTDCCTSCAKIGARFRVSSLLWCQSQSQRPPLRLHRLPGSLMMVPCFMIRLSGVQMVFPNLQKRPPVSLGVLYSITLIIIHS